MEYSCTKDVGEYLLILQECSSKVLIGSPNYQGSDYRGDLIADSRKLAKWAKEQAKTVTGCGEIDAARLALPFWLANANFDDKCVTEIGILFRQVIEANAAELLDLDIAYLFCHECNNIDMHPILRQENIDNTDRFNLSYILDWKCSQGHLLRYTEHKLHINY